MASVASCGFLPVSSYTHVPSTSLLQPCERGVPVCCQTVVVHAQVIDDQVDMLAASAAKALGSLWGGFSNVAKTSWTVGQALTTKVTQQPSLSVTSHHGHMQQWLALFRLVLRFL